MRILIVAATHGNELLGIKLYERLLKQHSVLLESIDFVIGNPRAYAKSLRYIDKDLNRSYGIGVMNMKQPELVRFKNIYILLSRTLYLICIRPIVCSLIA